MELRRLLRRFGDLVRPWRARRRRRRRWHSVSSCSEYQLCPRRYRFGYVDRVPAARNVPTAWRYGSVVHRGLEVGYRAMMDGAPVDDLLQQATLAVEQAWVDDEMPDDPAWLDQARRVVTAALERGVAGGGEILGVEQGFRHEVAPGLRFTGFADLVVRRPDGAVEIIDHKVTRFPRTPVDLSGDTQLNLYGWFASRMWPDARMVRASHHYPLLEALVTTPLSPERMQQTVDRLAGIARRAQADREMAPSPGEHCGHCSWLDLCDAGTLFRRQESQALRVGGADPVVQS